MTKPMRRVEPIQSRKVRRKEERTRKKEKRVPQHDKPVLDHQRPTSTQAELQQRQEQQQHQQRQQKQQPEEARKRSRASSADEKIAGNNREHSIKRSRRATRNEDDNEDNDDDRYGHLDAAVAAAMRYDDEEIAALEAKLGASSKQGKNRLYREYATLECYGEDFGDFLDDVDGTVSSILRGNDTGRILDRHEQGDEASREDSTDDDYDDGDDDEVVPMKGPAIDPRELHSASSDNDDDEDSDTGLGREHANRMQDNDDSESETSTDEDSNASSSEMEPDHKDCDTYKPRTGEDIYGKSIIPSSESGPPNKYLPPHLRKKAEVASDQVKEQQRQQLLTGIQRSVNSILNRLSEDTLSSVAQSIAKLYPSHSTSDVNECIWNNARNVCVATTQIMTGMIPVYIAALSGVQILKGDSAQLAEYLIERIVVELWKQIQASREQTKQPDSAGDPSIVRKEPSNLVLCLCYLYCFGTVHCLLLYDVIRNLIEHFTEVDVELLLIILAHCGRSLRSDDPSALKDIVLLVQKRSLEASSTSAAASRVDFMVAAIVDLKNNRRRAQDSAYADKAGRLRKMLGQIKSKMAASDTAHRSTDSSLRITLADILNAETKGRWWKIGASWSGNQYRFQEDGVDSQDTDNGNMSGQPVAPGAAVEEDSRLLKLAAKYRMNTDVRRVIFCIIMGSSDCDDAFEKLVRAEMLKNRNEREAVRVLIECCGNEKAYNKFYAHLSSRMCDYQPQCKFSFQLAFWDVFKQFETTSSRKAANLAKLLFHLVVVEHALKLTILKAIDLSSLNELPEPTMIFVTIFLSSIVEHFDNPSDVTQLIHRGTEVRPQKTDIIKGDGSLKDFDHMDSGEALRANLTLFFVQVLKASPKYKTDSKFKANLKAAIKACDADNFF